MELLWYHLLTRELAESVRVIAKIIFLYGGIPFVKIARRSLEEWVQTHVD